MDDQDRRMIACNYTEPVSVAAQGALAYVMWPNWGGGNDRVPLLVRSRGGRWIQKWEAMWRLGNFRLKTIPPEHPLYADDRVAIYQPTEEHVARFREACEREHLRHQPAGR
jgi:hypothetical protein